MATYTAVWNGQVIASSDQTVRVEGNQYFPLDAVEQAYLRPSSTRSTCPWKGEAAYYTLEVGGRTNPDAAWCYPQPSPAAENIRDHVAFWHGVQVKKTTPDGESGEPGGFMARMCRRMGIGA